jgi:cytochrome P450
VSVPESDSVADLDPFGDGTSVPTDVHTKLRATCPIAKLKDGSYYLATFTDVHTAAKSVHNFIATFRNADVTVADDEKTLNEIEEPRHGKIRRVLNSAITGHKLDSVAELIRTETTDRIAPYLDGRPVDLVDTLAKPLPPVAICQILGAPLGDAPTWREWVDEVTNDRYIQENRNDRGEGFSQCFPHISAYLDSMIMERCASPDPRDFIAKLAQYEVDGQRLSVAEIRMVLFHLFSAGIETTQNLIGNLCMLLVSDSELFRALRSDPNLIPNAIEECLRLYPPLPYLPRECTNPVDIGSVHMVRGERAIFGYASANRDESRFENPHEFRLDRPDPWSHLTFSAGPHICPGASLARLETRVAFETLLESVEQMVPVPGWTPRKSPVWWTNGPVDVRVRLTKASRSA